MKNKKEITKIKCIEYKKFIIRKRMSNQCDLYKDFKFLTTSTSTRALKDLVTRYYSDDLTEFEKEHIFNSLEKEEK